MEKPHMKLPNGDVIHEGEYGVNRMGEKIGPMLFRGDVKVWAWEDASGRLFRRDGSHDIDHRAQSGADIIAKWPEDEVRFTDYDTTDELRQKIFAKVGKAPQEDTPQPDYNDGKWHGWNGGECPVHPKDMVSIETRDCDVDTEIEAGEVDWDHARRGSLGSTYDVINFRVTEKHKEHKEPREVYLAQLSDDSVWLEVLPEHENAVKFREVMEGEE
jgi:hypothetical protein